MNGACVLIAATCPDPKLAKAALAPFHTSRDGQTTFSTSGKHVDSNRFSICCRREEEALPTALAAAGRRQPACKRLNCSLQWYPVGFVLMHDGQPVVVTSAAAVLPLLQQRRRQALEAVGSGLGVASSADLAAGVQLRALSESDANDSGSGSRGGPQQPVDLRLASLAELPGVRQALGSLLGAPSIAGPGGWQLGWLLHRADAVQGLQQGSEPAQARSVQGSGSSTSGSNRDAAARLALPPAASPSVAATALEAAYHVALLLPASVQGAAALARHALAWPGSSTLCTGQPVAAVGAPFGALAPHHFTGFTACGIVSAAIPGSSGSIDSNSNGWGARASEPHSGSSDARAVSSCGPVPALLLSDLRCGPGMEGSPVFAVMPAAAGATSPSPSSSTAAGSAGAAAVAQDPERRLAGMLLPPIKSPAAQVEFALLAPGPAVAAAVRAALQRRSQAHAVPPVGRQQPGQELSQTPASPFLVTSAVKAAEGGGAGPPPSQLSAALQGIVAVLAGNSWASGVIVSPAGHILTNAHLFEPAMPTAFPGNRRQPAGRLQGPPPGAGAAAPGVAAPASAHPPARVLLPGSGSGGLAGGSRSAIADVVYVFTGPLDLAVLRLHQPAGGLPRQTPAWRPLALASQPPRPGQPVCVVGFPAFNPRGGLLGPVVTAGTLAKVRRRRPAG